MRLTPTLGSVAVLGTLLMAGARVPAQPAAVTAPAGTSAAATARIVDAAQQFVKTLDAAGRGKVQYPFDSAQKTRWSNFPSGMFTREGVRLGDLTPAQRTAAMNLLATAFSPSGYRKVTDILGADDAFRATARGNTPGGPGGGRGPGGPPPGAGPPPGGGPGGPGGRPGGAMAFGSDEYYLAFVGEPSTTTPWMLQFGGHHLAINMTFGGARATLAPSLTGTQPASYTFEGRTVRPLGRENDRAFALIASLGEKQKQQAILGYAVPDLVLGPGKDGRTIQPEGIRGSALSAAQQSKMIDIVREWAGIANDAYGEPRLAEIRGTLADTYFAWSGETTPGSAAYFRIQGPTLVIEYAPQRDADHIHTIYRDPTNDYGVAYRRP